MMILIILINSSVLNSCGNSTEVKQRINEIKLQDTSTIHNAKKENTSEIVGYWFIPHSASVNLHFYSNGYFGFNDYNLKLDQYEYLKGTYKLNDSILTLQYNDRPQQTFKFYKGSDDNYYIKKRGYYFIKSDSL